jgi:hypothetical protein
MSLMNVTAKSLTQDLATEVPEIYVVIAKHAVLGMDRDSICEVLGCTDAELAEVENDSLYKQVRQIVGAAQAQARVSQTVSIDAVEEMAWAKLAERMPYEKDSEFLLRVAAVANKAVRRQGPQQNVLDPSRAAGRTAITLTQRLVRKLSNGAGEISEERSISIVDGTMKQASFDEVDSLLSVSDSIPRAALIETKTAIPSTEEFDEFMQQHGG